VRYKLDLLGVQGIIFFFMDKEAKFINLEPDFFVHHQIVSAVKSVVFVSGRCHL
jgi:uncharacterized membrane protein